MVPLHGTKHMVRKCDILILIIFTWMMFSCEKEIQPPVVETSGVSDIGLSSITVSGSLVDPGIGGVSQHGFCWSLAPAPSIEGDSSASLGPRTEPGEFTHEIIGLKQKLKDKKTV